MVAFGESFSKDLAGPKDRSLILFAAGGSSVTPGCW